MGNYEGALPPEWNSTDTFQSAERLFLDSCDARANTRTSNDAHKKTLLSWRSVYGSLSKHAGCRNGGPRTWLWKKSDGVGECTVRSQHIGTLYTLCLY